MRCILYTLIETRFPLRSNVIHVRDFVLLFTYLHAGHILDFPWLEMHSLNIWLHLAISVVSMMKM